VASRLQPLLEVYDAGIHDFVRRPSPRVPDGLATIVREHDAIRHCARDRQSAYSPLEDFDPIVRRIHQITQVAMRIDAMVRLAGA
jgi:hypothetical protein